jgi:CCR4-NOT transcription complex subunit 1
VTTTLQFVLSLDAETMNGIVPASGGKAAMTLGENIRAVIDACLAKHPSWEAALPPSNGYGTPIGVGTAAAENRAVSTSPLEQQQQQSQQRQSPGTQDDIEESANQYFQQIYASEDSARKVVEILKSFKSSGNSRENDIFSCMIHNLFDEYRFFSKYPEKELRITGILFGLLIKEQLVSSITLGIALRYVLEALRKSPTQSPQSGKMFRFGMFALEQFKERLHEWPQYCSHIVQIPHLRDGFSQLVAEIDGAMSCDNISTSSSISTSGLASGGDGGGTVGLGRGDAATGRSADGVGEIGGGNNALSDGGGVLGGEISVLTHSKNQLSSISSVVGGGGAIAAAANAASFSGLKPGGGVAVETVGGGLIKNELVTSVISLKEPSKPRKAVFGPGLGRAVNAPATSTPVSGESSSNSGGNGSCGIGDSSQNETPPDVVLDRVQFLINNLSMSNVESKSHDLRDMLERKYFGWLGNYLVVKRISTQPNFHSLYLSFLDNLGVDYGRGLVEAILASVYVNVGKLLRSQKITTSTSERSLLKNLGSWLGQITLARNRPILQIMLDCKELLFQGYETGMLIAVAPFVAKILEGAKNSSVFRPPNPWLMGLLSVFRALYNVDDLKMNIKFEVEVLCKNLGLKLEDIPMRKDADLSKRVSPVKEKNPDFNMKSQASSLGTSVTGAVTPLKQGGDQGLALSAANSMLSSPDNKSSTASSGGDSAKSVVTSSSEQQQQTVIPNLAAYVNVNRDLTQLFHQVPGGPLATHVSSDLLKRSVPIAVDRAIREIIQPVVERSVSIACITAKAVVTKDFAMEADENKMRKAAQLMVANLAGSLALVTCREPLHTSISTHLRTLLMNAINSTDGASASASATAGVQLQDQEKSALDQCVAICSTENLELGCMLIEKAATEKAVRDIDEALAPSLSIRKNTREQKGQPYYDMSIFQEGNGQRYPKELPDPLRPKPGGLRPDQLLVYEAFQRISRQPTAPPSAQPGHIDSQGGMSNLDQLGGDGQQRPGESGGGSFSSGHLNLNAINAIAMKLDSSVSILLNTAGPRAQEISLAMIPPEHEIKQLISAVPRVVAAYSDDPSRSPALSSAETDSILSFSQGIFKRLYEVNLSDRLRLETLISLLEMMNKICPQLGRDMGTWATYAPTKTDVQRKLHRAVLLLLVRSDLIQIGDLDTYLAKNSDEGRDQVWLEFLILFVRTAVLEKIASPVKMPKMISVVQIIAEERSPVSHEINPAFCKAAFRLLEEIRGSLESGDFHGRLGDSNKESNSSPTHEECSSISPASLKHLTDASLVIAKSSQSFASADPPNAKQLVMEILVGWLRVQNDAASNDKIMAQFLQRLQQQFGVGSNDDQTERFFRLATEVVVESCSKTVDVNYQAVDGYAKLLSYIVRYMNTGGSAEQVSQQKMTLLNKVLGVITRSLVTSYDKARQSSAQWDQRPWFRLFLDLVCELNLPNPAFDLIKGGIVGIFGSSFHVVQPLVVPGVYLSHSIFMCVFILLIHLAACLSSRLFFCLVGVDLA